MSEFSLLTGNAVPEPPPARTHNPGRFTPLFEHSRAANGEWIALRAEGEVQRNRLSNLASRIRGGRVMGASAEEFEVRTKSAQGMLWIRMKPAG